MGRQSLIDALAWSAILLWIGFSIFFAVSGDADLFQRFGALGIVFGVIYYAILPPPVVHPLGQLEAQVWRDKTAIEVANGAATACRNVSELAAAVKFLLESEGKIVPTNVVDLAKPNLDAARIGESYWATINRDSEIESISSAMLAGDNFALKVERTRFITQATLVVVGTLQSGFGYLIVPAGVAH